jgi:hypothetical protein
MRVASYYRVSTGRQFANEASIPSQRQITSGFCNGSKHAPSTVVHIAVPVLIEQADLDRVQAKLTKSNPKSTPPRVVNGPSLLTGIAVCASCGSGMTRTGTTNRQGEILFVLLLRRLPAEGRDCLRGPSHSGGHLGRDHPDQS